MQTTERSTETTDPPVSESTEEARWRPSCRFVVSVLIGAGITDLIWRQVPHQLSVTTQIVGYQTWADFNYKRYLDAYDLIAVLFPLLSIAVCFVVGRWGPLRRSRGDVPPVYRITTVFGDEPDVAPSNALAGPTGDALSNEGDAPTQARIAPAGAEDVSRLPTAVAVFWTVARMAVPAAAVVIEVCLVCSPRQAVVGGGGLLAGVAYLVAVALGAALLCQWRSRSVGDTESQWAFTWQSAISLVNSLLALVVLPLLFLVSENTNVYVESQHRVVYYHWLPLWLVVVVTAGCVALWVRALRRSRSKERISAIEATVLTWLVGLIIFFLLVAMLPGALGVFLGFDDGQFLAAPQLIFHHGLFPWKDIFLLHGILQDVFYGAVGLDVFGNTRWGGTAGVYLFMVPLFWLVVYAFTAYFCRKNRLILVGLVVAVATGLLQGVTFRLLVTFLFLILFDRVLRRPTWRWCALFSGVVVLSCIVVPEALILAAPLTLLVVIFDAVRYRRGSSIIGTFRRSIRCISAGAALAAVWAIFLAAAGALGDFIDYYSIASTGHQLEGAYPTDWNLARTTLVTFEFFVPVVLWLMTVWRVVAKLRARKPWTVADWVMVGAASFVVLYYPQVLERADVGHVLLVFSATLPLLILWAIELLSLADRAVPRWFAWLRMKRATRSHLRPSGVGNVQWPKRLVTAVAVVGIAAASVAMPTSISTLVRSIPAKFHAVAPDPAPSAPAMLGYTQPGAVDTAQINALGKVLDRYAGRHAPVLDFVSEVGVTYYLLNRVPGTRQFVVSNAQTPLAQNQTVSDLEKSRPPVVIFWDANFGLPVYDGILESVRTPIIAEYILDHYQPLVDVQGQLLMLRDDLVRTAPPLPTVSVPVQTTDLYFSIPRCELGDIPNFYSTPDFGSSPSVAVRTTVVGDVGSTIGGWAIDPSTGGPVSEVLAVANGKVVATAGTGLDRPDVVAALHDPSAETSGFSIDIPRSVVAPVTLFAVNPDGSVTRLQRDSRSIPSSVVGDQPQNSVRTSDGVAHSVTATGADGWVDSYKKVDEEFLRLTFPRGTNLSAYRWLQLRSRSVLGTSSNFLTNDLIAASTHEIGFNSLPQAGRSLSVQVGSCLQWRGYHADTGLYLVRSGPGATRPVSVELRR